MRVTSSSKTSRERVRTYRERLRAKGLRPVTFWLPDPQSAAFLAQARTEARAVSQARDAAEVMAFIADLQDWPADEEIFWREPDQSQAP